MKKIGLLMCMLGMAFGLHAQNFEIYVNGVKVKNGDIITAKFVTDLEEALHAYTVFKNTGSSDITLTGTKADNLPAALKGKDLWCIFEQCQNATAIEAARKLKAGEMFSGNGEYLALTPEGYVGNAEIVYTFATKEQPDSKISFTMKWELTAVVENRMKMFLGEDEITDGHMYTQELTLTNDPDEVFKAYTSFQNPSQEEVIVAAEKKAFLNGESEEGWCMLGNCWTGNTFEAEDKPLAPGMTIATVPGGDEHYFDYTPNGYEGVSYTYYTFYDKKKPGNRLSFAIAWKTQKGKDAANEVLADVIKSSAYPNPASETARLTWDAAEGAVVLNVRNLSGQVVYSRNVEGMTSAEIAVSAWTPGMYFYTIERQGERLGGGKLLVR